MLEKILVIYLILLLTCSQTFALSQKSEKKAWERGGFSKVKIYHLNADRFATENEVQQFTHKFALTVVLIRESGWTINLALENFQKAYEIFAQCGVKLNKIKLVIGHAPLKHRVADFGILGIDRFIALNTPPTLHPIVYLMEDTNMYFIETLNIHNPHMSYAYFEKVKSFPELVNTTWVSSFINMNSEKRLRAGYNSLAHELGHILLNDGHVLEKIPNLMSEYVDLGNNKLTKKQCEKIKNSPLVFPL